MGGHPQRQGSVTIMGSVKSDRQGEDRLQTILARVQTFWAFDRHLAAERHFPSVNWDHSFSHLADAIASQRSPPEWYQWREEALLLVRNATDDDRGQSTQSEHEKICNHTAKMLRECYLQQNLFSQWDRYCTASKAHWMLQSLLRFHKLAVASLTSSSAEAILKSTQSLQDSLSR